jgi:hypothetical protein
MKPSLPLVALAVVASVFAAAAPARADAPAPRLTTPWNHFVCQATNIDATLTIWGDAHFFDESGNPSLWDFVWDGSFGHGAIRTGGSFDATGVSFFFFEGQPLFSTLSVLGTAGAPRFSGSARLESGTDVALDCTPN